MTWIERIYFLICIPAIFIVPVHAYLDPSVTTYVIQTVASIAVAVGAVGGIYWRKAKKRIREKLGMNENTKKEIEDDIIEIME